MEFAIPVIETASDVEAVMRMYRDDIIVTSSLRIDSGSTPVQTMRGKDALREHLLEVLEVFGAMLPEYVQVEAGMTLVCLRTPSRHTITLALRFDEAGLVRSIRAAHGHRRQDQTARMAGR